MFETFNYIHPRYMKGAQKPFRFMLMNPLEGDLAQADLTATQAERVLTKLRKYETIVELRDLKVWIAEHLRIHHR